MALDRRLLLAMRTRGHGDPRLERAVAGFSRTGEHAACWFALGACGLALSRRPERRRAWRHGLQATAFAYGLNFVIKRSVRRARPQLEGLPALSAVVSNLSFPSAHSTTSFAAAGTYARALPAAAPLFYAAAASFAVSRPYLGVHYPSDVATGALLGSAVAKVWPR